MSRLRAFLLWALMLAVPFQGYAAASMVFCGAGQADSAATVVTAQPDAHDHATHSHGAATPSHDASDAKASQAGPDAQHTCATCASCGSCHAVALTSALRAAVLAPAPQADLVEPFHAMASIPPRVLDKPPRA